jgi:hypothetical protein
MLEAYLAPPSPKPMAALMSLPPLQLLVVAQGAPGSLGGSGDCLPAAADRLAHVLNLPVRTVATIGDPQKAMAQLSLCPGPWLAALPIDPGLALDAGGSWAELLGAWRQPSLLVLEHVQLATGLPAAGTALLQRWQVPLVGLVQWGGPWDLDARRRDGLPWLGCMAGRPAQQAEPLGGASIEVEDEALALRLRWHWAQLDRLGVA